MASPVDVYCYHYFSMSEWGIFPTLSWCHFFLSNKILSDKRNNALMLWCMITHSQVIIRAAGAGLQVEIRKRQEELAALAGSDVPVALSIRVVGQRVVGGWKSSRRSCQSPTTSLEQKFIIHRCIVISAASLWLFWIFLCKNEWMQIDT